MLKHEKELWLSFIEKYKEYRFLWDPKHQNYTNKPLRNEAYEELFEIFQQIDDTATMVMMKKKFDNMRTTYNRERKKYDQSIENGTNYTPTLWYYEHLSFLTEKIDTPIRDTNRKKKVYSFNFDRHDNKIYLEKSSMARGMKRKSEDTKSNSPNQSKPGYINIEPLQSSDDEENTDTELAQPKQQNSRLYDLVQRRGQMDTASRILAKKEEDWEVIGKAIGLQLTGLEETQRTIAHKLISDTIFYGGMGKLTLDSYVNVEQYSRESPAPSMDASEVLYVDPGSPS